MPCECDGSVYPRHDDFPGEPAARQGETVLGQWWRPVVVKMAVVRVGGGVRSLLFLPNGGKSLSFGSHPSGRTVMRVIAIPRRVLSQRRLPSRHEVALRLASSKRTGPTIYRGLHLSNFRVTGRAAAFEEHFRLSSTTLAVPFRVWASHYLAVGNGTKMPRFR